MRRNWTAAAGAALMLVSFVAPIAQADTIASVEAARTRLRTGSPLSPRDRAMLRRWGTSGDYDIPRGRVHRHISNGGY